MRYLVILILLCMMQSAAAATLSGTAYTHELEVAKYSLLSIDTAPPQRLLLQEGTYNISVPKGTYNMTVSYSSKGQAYSDELIVVVTDDGAYNYDFILFPTEGNASTFIPYIDDDIIIPDTVSREVGPLPAALLLLALIVLALTLSRRNWWKRGETTAVVAETVETPKELPADLESIITAVREEGGRATQKELRKRIPCSEAKMSMMLTELEAKGRIERIKKGRGNLIILK